MPYKNLQEKSQIIALRKRLRSKKEALRRVKQRETKLKNAISQAEERVHSLNKQSIIDKCNVSNLSHAQQLCIQEIIAAARAKSPRGHRFTEDWVMLYMLMHIWSPKHCRFLLRNDVLPLPALRTICRYLSIINAKCGFDDKFFELFQKHLEGKSMMEKHGILLLDEISLRESISVCSSTRTYQGLADFGDRVASHVDEKATHGLVLMYKAIAAKYTQPIAVFASKGPAQGTELAKIVIEAIMLLANVGAMVHGIISDGATTNRTMWSDLGISGVKDKCQPFFTHPCEESRKIFVLSDTSHLIKTIRNRLEGKKQLMVSELFWLDIL